MSKNLWVERKIGLHNFDVLNLDNPEVEEKVLSEMDSGVDVYYDNRWTITDIFCEFLLEYPSWIKDRSVLVIGAGIGIETLVIGRLCEKIHINDLAPVALDLCAKQLERNNIHNFKLMPGRYENLSFPAVEIVIGSYLVYNRDTADSMCNFLGRCSCPVLLMNEDHPEFRELLEKFPDNRCLVKQDGFRCIQF